MKIPVFVCFFDKVVVDYDGLVSSNFTVFGDWFGSVLIYKDDSLDSVELGKGLIIIIIYIVFIHFRKAVRHLNTIEVGYNLLMHLLLLTL